MADPVSPGRSLPVPRPLAHPATALLPAALAAVLCGCGDAPAPDYTFRPVPFTQVKLEDAFWLPRLETNRTVTLPHILRMLEGTGRIANFDRAAGTTEGPYEGRRFNDTDVYKFLEGVAYSLASRPDPELQAKGEAIIRRIAAAQEPDGYLYPARTANPQHPAPGAGSRRWINLQGSHELYNAGHLYEAAVAWEQATGSRSLLDVAVRNADLLVRTFGRDGFRASPGHEEIEIGLPKLYRATGRREYLDLARFFLEQRGRPEQTEPYPEDSPFAMYNGLAYRQAHLPVIDQTEAVGHAVRAMYLYVGMADMAALSRDARYTRALDAIWEDVVGRKLYLTGGVGARGTVEAFGEAYELPNRTAYTETCAAIGNALWNHRMFLLHGDARYLDVLERILYNGLLSGVSISGDGFFYQNPLESTARTARSPWFEVACCPGNVCRSLPSIPGYFYAVTDEAVTVNLFAAGTARVTVAGRAVTLRLETRYPWEGRLRIVVEPERPGRFELRVRIPGWARGEPVPSDLYRFLDVTAEAAALSVNGRSVPLELEQGFVRIRRRWQAGDEIVLELPMPVRRVAAHDSVADDRGRVALQRGPVVYCLEEADNGSVLDLELDPGAPLLARFRPDLLGGVTVVQGTALRSGEPVPFLAVPYATWANRETGEMAVWLPVTGSGVLER
jgi:DUF1680 family protein